MLLVRAFPSACSGWGPCCYTSPSPAAAQGSAILGTHPSAGVSRSAPCGWGIPGLRRHGAALLGSSPGRRSAKQVVTKEVVIPESANGSGRSLARMCSLQLWEANGYHQGGGQWEEAALHGRCSRLGETPAMSACCLVRYLLKRVLPSVQS